ncbi:MAG TPA: hypothetical protein VGL82_03125 [Bryobacteraceae bacterium]|jgi:hypothetical protein
MAMWQKSDPGLIYLNSRGYNVVRYPSAKLRPLGLIGRAGTEKKFLGKIDRVWKTELALPVEGEPELAPGIEGSMSCETDLSFGLNFLANALAIFGAKGPGLELSYKKAQSVEFRFGDVRVAGIDPLDIGDYFTKGSLRMDNPVVKLYLLGEDNEMLLITEVLQAGSISVTAKTNSGEEIALDVPAIEGLLGAKVGVKPGAAGRNELTYEDKEGRNSLPIGFKAFRLYCRDGALDLEDVAASGSNAFAEEEASAPSPVVFAEGSVDLDFKEIPE